MITKGIEAYNEGRRDGKKEIRAKLKKQVFDVIDKRLNQIRYRIRTGFGTKLDYIAEISTLSQLKTEMEKVFA